LTREAPDEAGGHELGIDPLQLAIRELQALDRAGAQHFAGGAQLALAARAELDRVTVPAQLAARQTQDRCRDAGVGAGRQRPAGDQRLVVGVGHDHEQPTLAHGTAAPASSR
jgi:hypothetical protein